MNQSAIKQMAALVWFAFMSVSLWGQGFHVYTKDGQRHDFLHADVDSIVFASDAIGEEQPPVDSPTVPKAVDLGLPSGIKWATCNVGAHSPEEYGDFYAWGETEVKKEYSWKNYKWGEGKYSITKYNRNALYGTVDGKRSLEPEDDVAHVKWGESWRMPTWEEITELYTNCTWEWTNFNEVYGQLVTGPNGNSIFLPAAGCGNGTSISGLGYSGFYWSVKLGDAADCDAYKLNFFGGDKLFSNNWANRYYGCSVRPVCE